MADKIVWILGAGFSRSLGGPLLSDLFSPHMSSVIQSKYSNHFDDGSRLITDAVRLIYYWGTNYQVGDSFDRYQRPSGIHKWDHAEEFLQKLDELTKNGKLGTELRIIDETFNRVFNEQFSIREKINILNFMAKKMFAAECIYFLDSANLSDEKWLPYFEWYKHNVGKSDTIITFNYDTTIETLSHELLKRGAIDKNKTAYVYIDDVEDENKVSDVTLLKLHGSTNWSFTGEKEHRKIETHESLLKILYLNHLADIAIGTPGPSKSEFSELTSIIWNKAAEKIKQADALVFLGYRFPPSDSKAKMFLLDAVEKNEKEFLPMHIVLGTNRNDGNILRLESLLHNSRRKNHSSLLPADCDIHDYNIMGKSNKHAVIVQPMYAEDFIQVMGREQIKKPFI